MRKWMPILGVFKEYRLSWLGSDIIAGATVWGVIIPLAMAYAGLVGVDPIVGIYTLPLALLGYAFFGGSRFHVTGADAGVSVLAGATVAAVVVGDETLELAIALALIVGLVYIVFGLFKMGWVADLIPDPVLTGFTEGIVWVTLLSQLPALLGLELAGSPDGFFERAVAVVRALPDAHGPTAMVGLSCVAILVLGKRFVPKLPGPLTILVVSILAVTVLGLSERGVAVVGSSDGGFTGFNLPTGLAAEQILALVPGALAIVVLGYAKSVGCLKKAAENGDLPTDPDRELFAVGAANIGAGLGGGYPVTGSLTSTAVNIAAGGRTHVWAIFSSILCVLTLLFLLPVFTNLPSAGLAAIVVVAMIGLSDLRGIRRSWSVHRYEFVYAMAAFFGVLVFDILTGVMIGVVLALFGLAQGIRRPTVAVVGRTPSGAFVDTDENPEASEVPGLLIWRQYGPLAFLNARTLAAELMALARDREGTRVVVIDATTASGIDSTAAAAFIAARDELASEGIELWVANPRRAGWDMVRKVLGTAGAEPPRVFESLDQAVGEFERAGGS